MQRLSKRPRLLPMASRPLGLASASGSRGAMSNPFATRARPTAPSDAFRTFTGVCDENDGVTAADDIALGFRSTEAVPPLVDNDDGDDDDGSYDYDSDAYDGESGSSQGFPDDDDDDAYGYTSSGIPTQSSVLFPVTPARPSRKPATRAALTSPQKDASAIASTMATVRADRTTKSHVVITSSLPFVSFESSVTDSSLWLRSAVASLSLNAASLTSQERALGALSYYEFNVDPFLCETFSRVKSSRSIADSRLSSEQRAARRHYERVELQFKQSLDSAYGAFREGEIRSFQYRLGRGGLVLFECEAEGRSVCALVTRGSGALRHNLDDDGVTYEAVADVYVRNSVPAHELHEVDERVRAKEDAMRELAALEEAASNELGSGRGIRIAQASAPVAGGGAESTARKRALREIDGAATGALLFSGHAAVQGLWNILRNSIDIAAAPSIIAGRTFVNAALTRCDMAIKTTAVSRKDPTPRHVLEIKGPVLADSVARIIDALRVLQPDATVRMETEQETNILGAIAMAKEGVAAPALIVSHVEIGGETGAMKCTASVK